MNIKKYLTLAAAVLLITLVVQIGISYRANPGPTMFAEWKDRPATLQAVTNLAEQVVVGRVVKIERAADLVGKAPKAEGNINIPVEAITIEVEQKLKGEKKQGKETIAVFHTGLSSYPSLSLTRRAPRQKAPKRPKDDDPNYTEIIPKNKRPRAATGADALPIMLHGDPAYKVGERYVLFVRKGPDLRVKGRTVATQAIISPESRYRLKRNNSLEAISTLGLGAKLNGKGLSQLQTDINKLK